MYGLGRDPHVGLAAVFHPGKNYRLPILYIYALHSYYISQSIYIDILLYYCIQSILSPLVFDNVGPAQSSIQGVVSMRSRVYLSWMLYFTAFNFLPFTSRDCGILHMMWIDSRDWSQDHETSVPYTDTVTWPILIIWNVDKPKGKHD